MAEINKRQYKTIGDAVGMPDHIDAANIKNIIKGYEAEHPGEIKLLRDMARAHSRASLNRFGVLDKDSGRRYMMELPPRLHEQLEAYIPTLFRERRHFHWFAKNFKDLLIPEKV